MIRRAYILGLAACAGALWAQGDLSAHRDMGAVADTDLPADEEEGVVETIMLGGEDRVVDQAQGVQQDDQPRVIPTPDSPLLPDTIPDPLPLPGIGEGKPIETSNDPSVHDPSRVAFATTRPNARTLSILIPAPRGLITDREGRIMADSVVAYQPTICYNLRKDATEQEVLAAARKAMADFEAAGLTVSEKTDQQLLHHYRNRRWLPLPVGPTVRAKDLPKEKREKLNDIPNGMLQSLYLRNYPAKESACHILGYTGTQNKLPTGPINHNDPIFECQEGRSGLEQQFNKQLVGRPGVWRLMFDEQGKKILDELQVKPRPGHTIVTTLNMEWQRIAENTLRKHTDGRGAFVLVDVHTGEVLVLASVPNYDPNAFIPSISQKDFDALRNDKSTPLVSRAFAGVYPPASTFKTITIAAALRYRVITEHTVISCPQSIMIGSHRFRNHSAFAGNINCITAIVLSNNPFMYQVAATREPRIGATRLCDMARRFGYGSVTGLPLPDKAGNVPDDAWMYRNYGRAFMPGDAANLSIGQGALLATPLQVAHAISGIANGRYLPKLQLIRQILDPEGNVVYQFTPAVQNNLADMAQALSVVRRGMRAVVDGGTGRHASLGWVSNAGKTGTAQWGRPTDECRLAWFAGFIPADKPRFAYAALYEGRPHQRISGGQAAAAIVRNFFNAARPSIQAALKESADSPALPLQSPAFSEDVAEDPDSEEYKMEQEEIEARQIRHQPTGWDTGRTRH